MNHVYIYPVSIYSSTTTDDSQYSPVRLPYKTPPTSEQRGPWSSHEAVFEMFGTCQWAT